MASKTTKMNNKQATVGNNIQVTLMIPHKFEIIRKLGSGKSQSVVMASYKLDYQTSIIYEETEGPTAIKYGIK
jgi:hypothetical protein